MTSPKQKKQLRSCFFCLYRYSFTSNRHLLTRSTTWPGGIGFWSL